MSTSTCVDDGQGYCCGDMVISKHGVHFKSFPLLDGGATFSARVEFGQVWRGHILQPVVDLKVIVFGYVRVSQCVKIWRESFWPGFGVVQGMSRVLCASVNFFRGGRRVGEGGGP